MQALREIIARDGLERESRRRAPQGLQLGEGTDLNDEAHGMECPQCYETVFEPCSRERIVTDEEDREKARGRNDAPRDGARMQPSGANREKISLGHGDARWRRKGWRWKRMISRRG